MEGAVRSGAAAARAEALFGAGAETEPKLPDSPVSDRVGPEGNVEVVA